MVTMRTPHGPLHVTVAPPGPGHRPGRHDPGHLNWLAVPSAAVPDNAVPAELVLSVNDGAWCMNGIGGGSGQ